MLVCLWTMLSEGDPRIDGRALGDAGPDRIERLLRAQVLSEQRPLDMWSPCTHCECGLDGRPIREVGDELRACCPSDPREDVVLSPEDVRFFTIDPDRLASAIAAASGLSGGVTKVADGMWLLGRIPSGSAVVLCTCDRALKAPGSILVIKSVAPDLDAIVVIPRLSTATRLRLEEASLATASLEEVTDCDHRSRMERLDPERLRRIVCNRASTAGASDDARSRLEISRSHQSVRLDGQDIVLSLTGYDALLGAAEKLVSGGGMLSYRELHSLTNRASHRDVINELRDQLEKQGLSRQEAFELVKTVHGRGMAIGLERGEVHIRD